MLHRPRLSVPDAITAYYEDTFPAGKLFDWLRPSSRETPYDLKDITFCLFAADNRVIDRHARFGDPESLVAKLVQSRCQRIEIGPLAPGPDHAVEEFRRFAVDIDIEDYHTVYPDTVLPTKETGLDQTSWTLLRLSALTARALLFSVLKTSEVTTVFSGRRGIHLWVRDRYVDWATRADAEAVVQKMEALQTAASVKSFLELDAAADLPCAEYAAYAREALRSTAFWINAGNDHLRRGRLREILDLLPDRNSVRVRDTTASGCAKLFCEINDALGEFWIAVGVLITAPRPDKEVTCSYRHLLKAPLSVHPGSGLVSVPFDPQHDMCVAFENIRIPVVELARGTPLYVDRYSELLKHGM